jgi:hypothetical protein
MQPAVTPTAVAPFASTASTPRDARCIEVSKRVRWDIDADVIRGRQFDFERKFMPDALSRIEQLPFLTGEEKRFLSQVQGRTYANMLALVERFIGAKTLEIGAGHRLGDQVALEALLRMTDEELKHQAMFRRLDRMAAAGMPDGYEFRAQANDVAGAVLGKSTWAVLALTLDIELVSQAHYRSSIEPDRDLSPLWKDVFLFHWKEESQHAILDELEWRREHARLSPDEREAAARELVELLGVVDGLCVAQAAADASYFAAAVGRAFSADESAAIGDVVLQAYRWQYVVSGMQEPRFADVLAELVTPAQRERIDQALAPIVAHATDGRRNP